MCEKVVRAGSLFVFERQGGFSAEAYYATDRPSQ
jgi:hypothetical protein